MSTEKLFVPTVHLNGTSGKDLYEGYVKARHAIHDAFKALEDTCPNGRDYYPQGPEAVHKATEQHVKRMDSLFGVYVELGKILEAIVDAMPSK
jgi:hypothetical protein